MHFKRIFLVEQATSPAFGSEVPKASPVASTPSTEAGVSPLPPGVNLPERPDWCITTSGIKLTKHRVTFGTVVSTTLLDSPETEEIPDLHNLHFQRLIKKFCRSVGCSLVDKFSPKVTHVIVKPGRSCRENDQPFVEAPAELQLNWRRFEFSVPGGDRTCEWTLKYFQGVAAGKWVLSVQWILDCLEKAVLLAEVDEPNRFSTQDTPLV